MFRVDCRAVTVRGWPELTQAILDAVQQALHICYVVDQRRRTCTVCKRASALILRQPRWWRILGGEREISILTLTRPARLACCDRVCRREPAHAYCFRFFFILKAGLGSFSLGRGCVLYTGIRGSFELRFFLLCCHCHPSHLGRRACAQACDIRMLLLRLWYRGLLLRSFSETQAQMLPCLQLDELCLGTCGTCVFRRKCAVLCAI